jgi:hypothetical protein
MGMGPSLTSSSSTVLGTTHHPEPRVRSSDRSCLICKVVRRTQQFHHPLAIPKSWLRRAPTLDTGQAHLPPNQPSGALYHPHALQAFLQNFPIPGTLSLAWHFSDLPSRTLGLRRRQNPHGIHRRILLSSPQSHSLNWHSPSTLRLPNRRTKIPQTPSRYHGDSSLDRR